MTKQILLSTLNARYIHSSFGLRYLKANLGELEAKSKIIEFTLDIKPEDVVEQILHNQPTIVGFGVYIWNVVQTEQVVSLLKAVAPEVVIVLGGPEVSYEQEGQPIVEIADYVIAGWGDKSFAILCQEVLAGTGEQKQSPQQKLIQGLQPNLDEIALPYSLYSDDDIKNRIIYVEASRGCPYKCEFCLSALDKTAWAYDLDLFLAEMDNLYLRGVRHFKFVDRTFNLKVKHSIRILQFFLDKLDDDLFLHFEMIPDHLPEVLKEWILKFPPNSLQFEIGIQTFQQKTQQIISRRQKNDNAKQNLVWLRENTNAHLHADLIIGLPGESKDMVADSFNQLYALNPHEIQMGILKRLKGSPLIRHTHKYQLVFNPNPPFNILSTSLIDYQQMQELSRFARYWDLIANSGRFQNSLGLLIADAPFEKFIMISTALYQRTGQTYKISLLRLFDLVFDIAVEDLKVDKGVVSQHLTKDIEASGLKSIPRYLSKSDKSEVQKKAHNRRQTKHTAPKTVVLDKSGFNS